MMVLCHLLSSESSRTTEELLVLPQIVGPCVVKFLACHFFEFTPRKFGKMFPHFGENIFFKYKMGPKTIVLKIG